MNRTQARALARAERRAQAKGKPAARAAHVPPTTYSHLNTLFASPTEPLPEAARRHQLTRMHSGLEALARAAQPTPDDWRVLSDAVNIMETLVQCSPWVITQAGGVRDHYDVDDNSGLLHDAVREMGIAGARHMQEGKPIRLDGAGIVAMRAVLADYADLLEQLPARVMVEAHRRTEQRIRDILSGRRQPHDVEVVAV